MAGNDSCKHSVHLGGEMRKISFQGVAFMASLEIC